MLILNFGQVQELRQQLETAEVGRVGGDMSAPALICCGKATMMLRGTVADQEAAEVSRKFHHLI